MNKKKRNWLIIIVIGLLFILFCFTFPLFYEVDGKLTILETEEISVMNGLKNESNLDEESYKKLLLEKYSAGRKSLLEIITSNSEYKSQKKENKNKSSKVYSSDKPFGDKDAGQINNTQSEINHAIGNNKDSIKDSIASQNNSKQESSKVPSFNDDLATNSNSSDPNSSTATTGKDAHDNLYANEFLTKDRGYSDEFYRNEENIPVILNYGNGNIDISDCVVNWAFGEPIVSLNKISKKMGLQLSIITPENFIKLNRSESYQPGDVPDLSQRYRYDIFLISPHGDAIRYQTGSTMQEDNEHYIYLGVFQVEGDREKDYETLVSISQIPYYDGITMKAGVPTTYKYSSDQILITMGNPEDSIGQLSLKDVQEITKE